MLTCKEIVRLLSSDETMPLVKRAELRLHLLVCKHCTNYSRQLAMLDEGVRKHFKGTTEIDSAQVERVEKQVIETLTRRRKP